MVSIFKYRSKAQWLRTLCCAAAALLLAGCMSDDIAGCAPDDSGGSKKEGYLILKLSLNSGFGGTRAGETRVDDATGDEDPNNDNDPLRPGENQDGINENKINTVHLFFQKKNPSATDKLIPVRCDNVSQGTGEVRIPLSYFTEDEEGNKPPIRLEELTNYDAYIGMNLSEAQAAAFENNNAVYAVPADVENSLGYGLTEEFAPGRGIGLGGKDALSAEDRAKYTRSNIAMFCIKKHSIVSATENEIRFDSVFNIKRNVAKVLVTCRDKYTGTGTGTGENEAASGELGVHYCDLVGTMLYPKGHELEDQGRGWMRQQDVKFMLSALNKKSYIQQRRNWNANKYGGSYDFIDPNYENQKNYIVVNPETNIVMPGNGYEEDFYYKALGELTSQSQFYVKTLLHDENKIPVKEGSPSINSDKYWQGLYCPENTFDLTGLDAEMHNSIVNYNYPWPMITFVSLTVKLTPRELYVEKALADSLAKEPSKYLTGDELDYKNQIRDLITKGRDPFEGISDTLKGKIVVVDCPNEKISWAILNASMRMNYLIQKGDTYIEGNAGFPERTYLTLADNDDDRTMRFYTYGAAMKVAEIAGWKPSNDEAMKQLSAFQNMPGGTGYFFTYIDNRPDSDTSKEQNNPETAYIYAQVERNNYYILTINTISRPGQPRGEDQFIKVHTTVVPWKEGGSANITLD